MRKGLGCGAVGDTRVDLANGQSEMVRAWEEGPHTATMPHSAD